jgi:hypothetical protein
VIGDQSVIRDGKKDVAWSAVGMGGIGGMLLRGGFVDETEPAIGARESGPVLSSHVPNPALAAQWPAYRPLSSRRRSRPLNPPFLDPPRRETGQGRHCHHQA